MPEPRTLQRNAADPAQVGYAGRKVKQYEERFEESLRAVMRTPAGRFVFWYLLGKAGIYTSVWPLEHERESRLAYNAGRQDFGQSILRRIQDADSEAYLLMEREMRQWLNAERREAAAVQQQSTDNGE